MPGDHDSNPLKTMHEEQEKLVKEERERKVTEEESLMKIERQYYNQEIRKILEKLEKELGYPIDVVYSTGEDGLVVPDSVRLVIKEGESPENMSLIANAQDKIIWWVSSAKGNVDFVDRSRVDLDESLKTNTQDSAEGNK